MEAIAVSYANAFVAATLKRNDKLKKKDLKNVLV
jgi:hypothetical protein